MRGWIRWAVSMTIVAHGLIHLLGAAQGLGWADVPQLRQPIGTGIGLAWLAAGGLVVTAGVLLLVSARWWWVASAIAAAASQAMILTAFGDAAAGTAANLLLLVAAGYGYAREGQRSFRAEYGRRVSAALAEPGFGGVVSEADLAGLPSRVAAYVRASGAVGRPRVSDFRARMHGRIRAGADRPWMAFTGEQVNTYGERPSRAFFIDATMFGLPVDVLHIFAGSDASMGVRVASVVPMVDVSGPDLTRAETVTLFNDLCVLAPAALVDAPVAWETLGDRRVHGAFTHAGHTVTAELVFNEHDELVDFVSDDRLAASSDGKSFTRMRWSTPLHTYGSFDGRKVAVAGDARWHPLGREPAFTYLELELDDIAYNVRPQRAGELMPGVGEPATWVPGRSAKARASGPVR